MMPADARIPVLIVPWPEPGLACVFEPDGRTVLVVTTRQEPGWASEPGWAAVRQVAPDQPAVGLSVRGGRHPAGCTCCVGRPPLVELLSELFRQRALGELPLFARVLLLVPPDHADAVVALLISDRLVAGRFRQLIPK